MKTRCPADEFYMKNEPAAPSPVIHEPQNAGFIQRSARSIPGASVCRETLLRIIFVVLIKLFQKFAG